MAKNNEKQWSSATPGLLIILLDQSGSMSSDYEGSTRAEFATKAVNNIIDTIIQKNFNGSKPKNRCFIIVIGYDTTVRVITSGYLTDLYENPQRLITEKIVIPDGVGGYVEKEIKRPVWIEKKAHGLTNMQDAFKMSKEIVEKWVSEKADNPAPVIINVSDGLPEMNGKNLDECQKETIQEVEAIKQIDTTDGKIQIFNAMIGNEAKSQFPVSKSEISGAEGQFLYEISTEIPESYRAAAEKYGFYPRDGALGMISHASGDELTGLIDFGSSKAH